MVDELMEDGTVVSPGRDHAWTCSSRMVSPDGVAAPCDCRQGQGLKLGVSDEPDVESRPEMGRLSKAVDCFETMDRYERAIAVGYLMDRFHINVLDRIQVSGE